MPELYKDSTQPIEKRVSDLLARMTIEEMIGQLNLQPDTGSIDLEEFSSGRAGAYICATNAWAGSTDQERVRSTKLDAVQKAAVEQSRLGIPVLVGRDVIHGYRTVCPIPLGQAAGWNRELVEAGAAMAAREARPEGITWTYTPMLDIARDARWGRIAEGFGEDPWLCSRLAAAAIRGYQGDDLSAPDRMAACAKHFVGYGAAEGGRDYDCGEITPNTMRNVYLRPFLAAAQAGVATVMTAFQEVGGVPATGNRTLVRETLKEEWQWDGMVVSDWGSVQEMVSHGFAATDAEAGRFALSAGCDMDMCTSTYSKHIAAEIAAGRASLADLDDAVARVLRLKFRLGLFERPYSDSARAAEIALTAEHRQIARQAAQASVVLLKNDSLLPLDSKRRVGVFGAERFINTSAWLNGCWTLDGCEGDGATLKEAISKRFGDVRYESLPDDAVAEARRCEANIVVLGESPARSGEAHSVVDIELPPGQIDLLERVVNMGKPVIALVVAGRPLALTRVCRLADAVLFAFHPGVEGANAIAGILNGEVEPLGRLPVSMPRSTGQVPIYYNHKRGGRPRVEDGGQHFMPITWIDELSTPLFPFGFGLGWTTWSYEDMLVDHQQITAEGAVKVSAMIRNTGSRRGSTVAQCYIRDVAASRTRPVRELRGFERVELEAGESRRVEFVLGPEELGFWGAEDRFVVEPGEFHVWIGNDCTAPLGTTLTVV